MWTGLGTHQSFQESNPASELQLASTKQFDPMKQIRLVLGVHHSNQVIRDSGH
jgi:hypothetical protein